MSKKPKSRTAFDRERTPTKIAGESRTKQSFRDEANINNLVAKYQKTGVWATGTGQPMYGDFSEVMDFRTAQNQIALVNQAFMDLPSSVRAQFENDPANLLEFLNNEENHEQAVEMGLMPKPEGTATPPPEKPAQEKPTATEPPPGEPLKPSGDSPTP